MKRGYSEDVRKEEVEGDKKPGTASNFLWMAGTGGFLGALIYFLGKPENDTEDASVRKKWIDFRTVISYLILLLEPAWIS